MTPAWRSHVDGYRTPRVARGAFEVASTVVVAAAAFCVAASAEFAAVEVVAGAVYAGALLRLFVLQHDCGHGALFPLRWQNDVVGALVCCLVITPYDEWRKSHALHHASSSHLGRRSWGDIYTMTVDEWRAASPLQRLRYRLRRNPVVLFAVAPLVVFLIKHRFKGSLCEGTPRGRNFWNVHLTTLVSALLIYGLYRAGGVEFVVVHGLALWFAGAVGVWLFYIQHQFEETFWSDAAAYDYNRAGLQGSSFYDLHPVLHWFTGNIGFHHIHHLDPRVPLYRLPACHRAGASLFAEVPRLTLWSSLGTVRLKLWDGRHLVPFE